MHSLAENAAQVDDRGRALDGVPDARSIRDVSLFKAELPDLAQRLDKVGAARVAARNAHPDSTLEQQFADVAADESAAAEDGYKLFVPLDHGVAR